MHDDHAGDISLNEAFQSEDIKAYIQRRRSYLAARQDTAETPADKGKIIGMLQALVDFEGMIRQLRVIPASVTITTVTPRNIPESCEDLANRWLSALALPGVCLDNFHDDKTQNRVIARNPEKKKEIMLLGQLIRNKALIDAVLENVRGRRCEPAKEGLKSPTYALTGNGGTCPYCGKIYKYAKALDTHVAWCPRKPTPR